MPRGTREPNPGSPSRFAYETITLYRGPFHILRLRIGFVTSRRFCKTVRLGPTTPMEQRLQAYIPLVWAIPGSLVATVGIFELISFPGGTEIFHFPPFTSYGYEFTVR